MVDGNIEYKDCYKPFQLPIIHKHMIKSKVSMRFLVCQIKTLKCKVKVIFYYISVLYIKYKTYKKSFIYK